MVLVPAGEFWQGAVANASASAGDEKPGRRVRIGKPYYVDVHEVTVQQWKVYAGTGEAAMANLALSNTTDDMPVYNVNWTEASSFARWAGVTLPTEAQWERAARGGRDEWMFPWGMNDDPKMRNASGVQDGFERIAPVGKFPANGYGLFDMAGNVAEWTADWYDAKYYQNAPNADPTGPATGKERVVRGGSYDRDGLLTRCSHRHWLEPSARQTSVGFRCTKSLP
jgi:iron(II)-dependent oxidoreductase